ncbi:MAG: DUF1653 domain-containing protein [Lachnospiraceae bacterium]|nr:DUF1653 domain-containing protein [Lachnospiraceae bacterium]
MKEPAAGKLYRHFKGTLYRVLTLADHTETGERLVIYREEAGEKVYARPLEMFVSPVDREKYPEAAQQMRFEPVSEEEAGAGLDPEVERFLDARTYREKLDILSGLHLRIDDEMINTMAIACGAQVEEGPIEDRYQALKQALVTLEKFECTRLR